MTDIDMEDYNTFDENIGALKDGLSDKEKTEYYLNRLTARIEGEASIGKIRNEVYNFIYVNTLMDPEIKKKLIELADGNYMDGNKLSTDILNYLRQVNYDREVEFNKNNEKVEEVKQDFVDRIDDKLGESKVELVGNDTELKDSLNSYDDLDKANDEVNLVNDTFADNEVSLELSTDDVIEAVNSPKEGILVDKLNTQLEAKNYEPALTVTEDGTVLLNAQIKNSENENYMAMMLMALTTSNMNLDMYLSKEKDSDDYKVVFGKLPTKNHPENMLDQATVSKIMQISNSYDKNVNYKEALVNANMSIGTLNSIIFSELEKNGTMKIGINNKNGEYDIGFSLSPEYQNLADTLKNNGANVSMDNNENSIVRVNGDSLNQYMVLSNTKEALEKDNVVQLTNNYQYVKKMDVNNNKEAARVSNYFLIVVAVTEILLVGFYFLFLFK